MFETKIEKFRRLFSKRMEKATDATRVIANLASPNYEIDPELVDLAVTEFEAQWLGIRESFGLPAVSQPINPLDGVEEVVVPITKTNMTEPPMGGTAWALMDQAYNALVDGDPEKAKELMLAGFKA